MRIAVEGCAHGELDKIYDTIARLEQESGRKVDLLLCCGDFQCTRNLQDLKCMACPDKYKSMCSFYRYYSGEKTAPVTTIFIGGNHEASNYLQELPFGGWVADNIYFLGKAGVVRVNGVTIGGLSGIFKGRDYLRGHHECPPYDDGTMRSVYHIRNLEVFRLRQLARSHAPDIVISHDWPRGVYHWGDLGALLARKKHFREEIERDELGSRPAQELMGALKPQFWFSAHLHVKFPAIVDHDDGSSTKFLGLDKCLPRRGFLQVLDVGEDLKECEKVRVEFYAPWLAVLKSTDHLLSVAPAFTNHMPGPSGGERYDFAPTEEEIKEVEGLLGPDMVIPPGYDKSVRAFNPQLEEDRLGHVKMPPPRRNSQTVDLCKKLGIRDPVDTVLEGRWPEVPRNEEETEETQVGAAPEPPSVAPATAEIELPEDSDEEEEVGKAKEGTGSTPAEGGDGFVVDASPSVENLSKTWENAPKKTLKRRNQSLYQGEEGDN